MIWTICVCLSCCFALHFYFDFATSRDDSDYGFGSCRFSCVDYYDDDRLDPDPGPCLVGLGRGHARDLVHGLVHGLDLNNCDDDDDSIPMATMLCHSHDDLICLSLRDDDGDYHREHLAIWDRERCVEGMLRHLDHTFKLSKNICEIHMSSNPNLKLFSLPLKLNKHGNCLVEAENRCCRDTLAGIDHRIRMPALDPVQVVRLLQLLPHLLDSFDRDCS